MSEIPHDGFGEEAFLLAEDAEGVATKLADAELRARVVRAECATAVRDAAASATAAAGAERLEREALLALAGETDRAVGMLLGTRDAASTAPGDLPRSRRLVDAMRRLPPSAWQAATAEARDEVAGVRAAAHERADEARNRLEHARVNEERRGAELEELRRAPEEQPRVRGFATALAALAAECIAAQPIYAMCEPRVGADGARLAWLEAMAGDEPTRTASHRRCYWHRDAQPQSDPFAAPESGEPAPELAECRT